MATITQLQTLFGKLGIATAQRHERIFAWTSGRTSSSKEMSLEELQELCDSLSSDLRLEKTQVEDAKRLRRSAILSIATRCGIKEPNDWDRFNGFMLYKSCVKKSLRLCDLEELERLIQQFRALEQHNAVSAQKVGTKAYFDQRGFPGISKN